jgi:uncharacterized protein YheU (UPF0270 family)
MRAIPFDDLSPEDLDDVIGVLKRRNGGRNG